VCGIAFLRGAVIAVIAVMADTKTSFHPTDAIITTATNFN